MKYPTKTMKPTWVVDCTLNYVLLCLNDEIAWLIRFDKCETYNYHEAIDICPVPEIIWNE